MAGRIVLTLAAALWIGPAGAQSLSGSIEGQTVDRKTGAPVKGATITLAGPYAVTVIGPHDHPGTAPRAAAQTDARGQFAFHNLASGNYALQANHEEFEPVTNSESLVARELIPVSGGEQVKGIVLKLLRRGTIAGKVVNEKGQPLQDARIAVYRYVWGFWTRSAQTGETGQAFLYTNDLGEYRVFGLMHGPYVVSASYPPESVISEEQATPGMGHPTRYYGGSLSPESAQTVMVASGEVARADIQLLKSPVYRIQGEVVDSIGPIPGGACVGIVPKGSLPSSLLTVGSIWSPTQRGAFTLRGLAPGQYILTGKDCGAWRTSGLGILPLEVAGNRDGVTIRLSPTRPVGGTVAREGCASLSGASVNLALIPVLGYGGTISAVRGDGGVTFPVVPPEPFQPYFRDLPADCYVKSVHYGGQDIPAVGSEPRDGASLDFVVSNQGVAQLSGSVVDKAGRPVRYPLVTAIPSDGGPVASARDEMGDAGGAFLLRALRPGKYKVAAWEQNPDLIDLVTMDVRVRKLFDQKAHVVKLASGPNQDTKLTLITIDEMEAARAKP